MPSRTDANEGESWAHVETDFMSVAAAGKRVGSAVVLTGASMKSLHINGKTEAAAAAVDPDDVVFIITATAAATAESP
jgi:aspartate 1-decarboxylase